MSRDIFMRLSNLRTRVLHAETAAKTIVVTVLSGAALTVHDVLTRVERVDDLFTHSGLVRLGHNALWGGSMALIGLFIKSPVRPRSDAPGS
jgi:hypothetical protein